MVQRLGLGVRVNDLQMRLNIVCFAILFSKGGDVGLEAVQRLGLSVRVDDLRQG